MRRKIGIWLGVYCLLIHVSIAMGIDSNRCVSAVSPPLGDHLVGGISNPGVFDSAKSTFTGADQDVEVTILATGVATIQGSVFNGTTTKAGAADGCSSIKVGVKCSYTQTLSPSDGMNFDLTLKGTPATGNASLTIQYCSKSKGNAGFVVGYAYTIFDHQVDSKTYSIPINGGRPF